MSMPQQCGTISALCLFMRSRDGILGIHISVQSAVDNSGHVPPVHIFISIIREERGVSASGLRARVRSLPREYTVQYTVQNTVVGIRAAKKVGIPTAALSPTYYMGLSKCFSGSQKASNKHF